VKKCYDKYFDYTFTVPIIRCSFCHERINPGDEVHKVLLTWGDGRTSCKKCVNNYEIDWSMREHETEEGEIDEF